MDMNDPLTMTPVEFEIFVRRYLEEQGRKLKTFRTEHLEKVQGVDGDYVIDVTARFEALGADILVMIECKRYSSKPVEREQVQALKQKMDSIGAHKAMLFTTSTFRKGAIDFAAVHGVALIQVSPKGMNYAVKSLLANLGANVIVPISNSIPEFLFDQSLPDCASSKAESKEIAVQVWMIGVLRERLDYLRIVAARGYEVDAGEIESVKTEIAEEEAKLEHMQGE